MKKISELSPAYRRRIERGLNKGLSRAAARGHAKSGEVKRQAGRFLDCFQ